MAAIVMAGEGREVAAIRVLDVDEDEAGMAFGRVLRGEVVRGWVDDDGGGVFEMGV